MLVQVVSDIHLEFFNSKTERKNGWETIVTPVAPILILAGDICQATAPPKLARLTRFLTWCSQHFQTVLYVPGNHEFYNEDNPKYTHRMCTITDALDNLQAVCNRLSNVFLLSKSTKIIDDICFIGATLWSSVPTPEAAKVLKEKMNDFEYIYSGDKEQLTPAQYNNLHISDRAFIERQLTNSCLKKVVITHHAPSYLGTCKPVHEAIPDFSTHANLQTCGYASALGDLVAQSDAWIFGHTHHCVDEMRGGCRLVANQRGYMDSINPNFNPKFTFEI